MLSRLLAVGIAPVSAPAEAAEAPAAPDVAAPTTTAEAPKPVPWKLLENRRLEITSDAGTTREGVLLGTEDGAAILEADDGTLISIAYGDIASVRTIRDPPAPKIPMTSDNAPLSFRQATRLENERISRVVEKTAIAGGVVASLSAAASIVAEGFNVARWSLTRRDCGEVSYSYGGYDVLCGWTDGTRPSGFSPYSGYDNLSAIAGASTIGSLLHFGGLLTLLPPTILRERSEFRGGRRRHFGAWALWGAGVASLGANQAVAWTQINRTRQVCDDIGAQRECRWITPTRGAPPGLYILSAGLTLTSAILGILDGKSTVRHAERDATASISVFPVSLQRGGGLGLAGRF